MQDNPQALLPKPHFPVMSLPGSRPLANARHEHYSRLRSLLRPKGQALREAGMRAVKNHDAVSNATRLERREDVRDRIAFLVRQEEEILAEKRKRIEETLWAIHEANIGDYFETHEIDGKTIERPKRLADLPREIRKNIEKIALDSRGRAVPQLYSKLAANQELRKILNIGRTADRSDVSRLSDAELIAQLSNTAKELGIKINLNYSFAQPSSAERQMVASS
jgi:hypothetical protein